MKYTYHCKKKGVAIAGKVIETLSQEELKELFEGGDTRFIYRTEEPVKKRNTKSDKKDSTADKKNAKE